MVRNGLFVNYFFIDFYSFDFFYDFLYPSLYEKNQFSFFLNFFHFYHFDCFYDNDLIVKIIYKSFSENFDSFLSYANDGDVSKELVIDFEDIRNSFF